MFIEMKEKCGLAKKKMIFFNQEFILFTRKFNGIEVNLIIILFLVMAKIMLLFNKLIKSQIKHF